MSRVPSAWGDRGSSRITEWRYEPSRNHRIRGRIRHSFLLGVVHLLRFLGLRNSVFETPKADAPSQGTHRGCPVGAGRFPPSKLGLDAYYQKTYNLKAGAIKANTQVRLRFQPKPPATLSSPHLKHA